jgi:glycosyltransferase involved in cell wall biosynthesis
MARTRALRQWARGIDEEPFELTPGPSRPSPEAVRRPQRIPSGRQKIVAAIPCYNEAPSIGDIVRQASKHVDQVIVVDDGSRDGTAEAAKAAGATVVNHESNKGYGEAILSCFKAARSNGTGVVVTLDGDNQHTPEEINAVVAPIMRGEADVVVGSRFLHSSPETNAPLYRRFGIGLITWLVNVGSRVKISDAQSGFRAYSREVIDTIDVTDTGMAVSVELLIKARNSGFVIREVPISCRYDSQSSTLNPLSHGVGVALAVIRYRLGSMFSRNGTSATSSEGGRG